MKTTLYVNNIHYSATREELEELFSEFGKVKCVDMIRDPDSDVFMGHCFIDMDSKELAELAIRKLNRFDFKGKPLRVSFARENDQKSDA